MTKLPELTEQVINEVPPTGTPSSAESTPAVTAPTTNPGEISIELVENPVVEAMPAVDKLDVPVSAMKDSDTIPHNYSTNDLALAAFIAWSGHAIVTITEKEEDIRGRKRVIAYFEFADSKACNELALAFKSNQPYPFREFYIKVVELKHKLFKRLKLPRRTSGGHHGKQRR